MASATFAFPLSFAQERLWFLDQLEPGTTAYNDPTALRLRGQPDEAALRAAFGEIVRRHEVLRTTFAAVDGVPSQMVSDPRPVPMCRIDLGHLTEDEREPAIHRIVMEEARRPFDLERGPLIRLSLVRLAADHHVLLVNLHHIVSDGWSTSVLVRELKALYTAFTRGAPSPLAELPIQYADYAVWQRSWLQGDVLEEHLAYWTRELADVPANLELSTDHARGHSLSFSAAHHSFDVPLVLAERVKELAHQEGATLFMTLLAAFEILLHRYTGHDDIVVGAPVAGRTRPETEPLIGFFVNTLALRARLSGNPTLRSVLRQLRATCLDAYDHQELPWERLVDALRPVRDTRGTPVFQVLFAVQNTPPATFELEGLKVESLSLPTTTAKFDLSLYAVESPGRLRLSFEYAAQLFEPETIEQLGAHYCRVLEALVSEPDVRLSEVCLLESVERTRMLTEWNATQRPREKHVTIPSLFDRQVRRTPSAVAISDGGRSLTFAELDQRANAVAQRLRALGVVPEVPVGLCAERSVELIIGLLGILKAGGAYVALEPTYPPARLAYMLRDTGAPVVLCQARFEDHVTRACPKVVLLEDAISGSVSPHVEMSPALSDESLMCVIYTSGSTGQPKGVLCTHAAAINRLAWMSERYPFEPGEVCCHKTALAFVDSVAEIWGPLLQGVPLVLIADDALKDPARLVATLAEHSISRIILVPTLLATLLDLHNGDLAAMLPRLRYCVSSGEALPADVAERCRRRLPHTRLLNLYGSSEVAADVTAHEVQQDPSRHRVLVGRPIANASTYVLDRYLQPVPRGVVGEVCVGGSGLARGYLNAPDLTAERFVPDLHGPTPGERLYRTGDLGRYLPDGQLELLGRRDHQVKIRGYRIELGEIEAALRCHPDVSEAVVVPFGEGAARRLVAYAAVSTPRPLQPSDLRAFLRGKLPDFMLPASFVMLDALPRTRSGKVDRGALPAPRDPRPDSAIDFAAPRTEIERAIAGVWQQTLGLERVGVAENFFDLGGNSLLAVRLRSRLQSALGVDLPLIELFRFPTIGTLAEHLSGSREDQVRQKVRGRLDRHVAARGLRMEMRRQHRASMHMRRGS